MEAANFFHATKLNPVLNGIGEYFSIDFILHNTTSCFEMYLPVSFWFKKDQIETRLNFSGSAERFLSMAVWCLSPSAPFEKCNPRAGKNWLFGSHIPQFINSSRIDIKHQCSDLGS